MAHEVENMFYVNEVPWHGLGIKLEAAPTVREAIVCAGLDWEVASQPQYAKFDGEEIATPSRAIIRKTDRKVLGVVGPDYEVVQNVAAFDWFQAWVDAGVVKLETAGSLCGGSRIWVLARVVGDPIEIVKNDAILRYILLSNSHDGTMAVRCGFTGTRVVCANTMAAAHESKASKLLRIRHTKNVATALEEIQNIMDVANREFVATTDQMKFLARCKVSVEDLTSYVRKVFTPKVSVKQIEGEEFSGERILAKVIPLFENGRGMRELPEIKGTLWAAYNAVSEFVSHERGRSQDSRVNSLWFGDSANTNQKAFNIAVEMAKAA
jgi:phage/plasmid-like protein (TIGR03299 family)